MKAEELRIGNLVYVLDQESDTPLKGTSVNITWLQAPNFLQPIPITEEWLLRFGFEIIKPLGDGAFNTDALKTFNNAGDTQSSFRLVKNLNNAWVVDNEEMPRIFWSGIFLTHVHQLQNLFFALTREELTIQS